MSLIAPSQHSLGDFLKRCQKWNSAVPKSCRRAPGAGWGAGCSGSQTPKALIPQVLQKSYRNVLKAVGPPVPPHHAWAQRGCKRELTGSCPQGPSLCPSQAPFSPSPERSLAPRVSVGGGLCVHTHACAHNRGSLVVGPFLLCTCLVPPAVGLTLLTVALGK